MTLALSDIEQALPLLTDRERAEIDRLVSGALPFRDFVRAAWAVVEPATAFVPNWHIDAIAEHLEAVADREIRRLIINIPPRCMKSLTVSVFWPAWVWTWRPSERFLFASYAQKLSTRDALKTRRIIASNWYQSRWGHVFQLTGDQNEKTRYENDKTGYRISTSVGGTGTGEGGDVLVQDDPHKADEVHSDTVREGVIDFNRETWSSRKNDPKRSAEVVVMQRLHSRDVTGYLLEEVGGYEHLMLPARYESARKCFTSIGWTDPREEEGELLWPDRTGPDEQDEIERALGTYATAGQQQQRPAPAEGGILKTEWFKTWEYLPERFDELVQSWDATFKQTTDGSFVVGQVWGRLGADLYLVDQDRARRDFPGTVRAIRSISAKWPQALEKLVEDKANGPAIVDTLRHELPGLIAVPVRGSKEARAHAIAPAVEAGNVYLPDRSVAPWVDGLLGEIAAFPNGSNDDQVDAMTQALDRLYRPDNVTEQKIFGV